jgi:hypothetical protein
MRIKVLWPDPALAEDGLSVGDEADMAPMRALPLIQRGVLEVVEYETRVVRGYERKGAA